MGHRWRVGGGGRRGGGTRRRARRGRPRRPRRTRRGAGGRRCRRGASDPSRGRSRVSSPTSTRVSSRGSVISRATTACRPAISVSAGSQSRGPRKSETMTTTPGVVRMRADDGAGRAPREVCAAALLGRFGGERAEEAEHARGVPPAGGVTDSRPAAERDDAEPVAAPGDEATDDERRALGDVGLAPVGGPEVHRRRSGPGAATRSAAGPARPRGPAGRASGRWRSSRSGGRRRPARTDGSGRARGPSP